MVTYRQATPGPIASGTIWSISMVQALVQWYFTILSSDVTIAGLAIYNSPGYAIRISPSGGAKPVLVYNNIFIWGELYRYWYYRYDYHRYCGNKLGGMASNVNYFDINANIIIGTDGNGTDDINWKGTWYVAVKAMVPVIMATVSYYGKPSAQKLRATSSGLNKNGGAGCGAATNCFGILLTVGADNNVIEPMNNQSDDVEINYICNNDINGIVIGQSKQKHHCRQQWSGLDINWNATAKTIIIHLLGNSENVIGTNGDGTSDATRKWTLLWL